MTQAADILRDRRRVWATPGGSHDRLVQALARYLPVGIGLVAAVMILAPLSPRSDVSFLLDRNKVAIVQERLRVDNATYRGVDGEERPFAVTAGTAVQKTARDPIVEMTGLVARIELSDGPGELSAKQGTYDFDREVVKVPGSVALKAADGYRMVTSNVTIDLKQRVIDGTEGVEGAIPSGTFSAQRINADLSERTITLIGNARLRMEPGKLRTPQ